MINDLKPFSLIVIFMSISVLGFGQNEQCKKFKNGTFYIPGNSNSNKTIITRKGSTQTETYRKGKELKFKVKWISDCSYTLTPTKKTFALLQSQNAPDLGVLTVKIIHIKENSYIQESTSSKVDFVYRSEIFLIKK